MRASFQRECYPTCPVIGTRSRVPSCILLLAFISLTQSWSRVAAAETYQKPTTRWSHTIQLQAPNSISNIQHFRN
jgi:hypothetical protein